MWTHWDARCFSTTVVRDPRRVNRIVIQWDEWKHHQWHPSYCSKVSPPLLLFPPLHPWPHLTYSCLSRVPMVLVVFVLHLRIHQELPKSTQNNFSYTMGQHLNLIVFKPAFQKIVKSMKNQEIFEKSNQPCIKQIPIILQKIICQSYLKPHAVEKLLAS